MTIRAFKMNDTNFYLNLTIADDRECISDVLSKIGGSPYFMNFEITYSGSLAQDPMLKRDFDPIQFFNHLPPEFMEDQNFGVEPVGMFGTGFEGDFGFELAAGEEERDQSGQGGSDSTKAAFSGGYETPPATQNPVTDFG